MKSTERSGMDLLPFKDRKEAGIMLAEKLKRMKLKGALVLGIPRGGVVVGLETALELGCDFDVIAPRKLRDPYEPELAIGAIMPDGSAFLNEPIIEARRVQGFYIDEEKKRQVVEASRRMRTYRKERKFPRLKGRTVLIVDDGIATGATMIAAARWVRNEGAKVVIAIPVMPVEVVESIRKEASQVVCLATPEYFTSVGQFYTKFDEVTDEMVTKMLNGYQKKKPTKRDKSL